VIDSRTRTKILQAALHHIALYGEERLSMSGVASEAKVSRGTVYRYFTNREELLDAIALHVRQTFENGVVAAAAEGGDTSEKLDRIVAQRIDPDTRQAVRRLRELQPAFTLEFLTEHLPEFRKVYARALRDDFDRPDLRLSLDDFVEQLVRITVMETLCDLDPEETRRLVVQLWDLTRTADRSALVETA